MNSRAFIYLGCTFLNVGGKRNGLRDNDHSRDADQTGHTTCQLTKSETLERSLTPQARGSSRMARWYSPNSCRTLTGRP